MVYWIFASGFGMGLYMRHNDQNRVRSAETAENTRHLRDSLFQSFQETIRGTTGIKVNLTPFKFQTSIGRFFDDFTKNYVINGLYKSDVTIDIKTISNAQGPDKKD